MHLWVCAPLAGNYSLAIYDIVWKKAEDILSK
jgi:hypothetical protein